jgi:hypothetical protein
MSDTVDKAKAWDTLAKRSAKITRLTARVAELEGALEKINVGDGWAALIARAALTQPAE